MEQRLVPLNAFVMLSTPLPGFAKPKFLEAGWRLVGIEVPVTVQGGPDPGTVTVDAVSYCESNSSILLVEAKSGNNVEPDQCHRYHAAQPEEVVRAAGMSVGRKDGPLRITVLYSVFGESTSRIRFGITQLGYEPTLLTTTQESEGARSVLQLDGHGSAYDYLRGEVDLPEIVEFPIADFVPLDQHSGEELYLPRVRAALVAEQSKNRPSVSVPALAEVVVPCLPYFSNGAKSLVIRKVEAASRSVANDRPEDYRFQRRTGTNRESIIEILRSPEGRDRRGRTQAYQALARQSTGRRGRSQPGQMDLLADLGLTASNADSLDESPEEGVEDA